MAKKPNIGPNFGPHLVHQIKNLAPSVTRYHGQLSPSTIENANDPILRKLSDGWTDRRTGKIS